MSNDITRRKFIRSNSALAGFFILPSGLLANSPNGRLASAHIGTGGKGAVDTAQIAAHPKTQVVALCEDEALGGHAFDDVLDDSGKVVDPHARLSKDEGVFIREDTPPHASGTRDLPLPPQRIDRGNH